MPDTPILVGQYDSPFVRRVAVALHHYGVPFERRVLSTFADFNAVLDLSPLGKVPVFVFADSERLWDSRAILDVLHGQANPEHLLLPHEAHARRLVLRVEATALGLAEKSYERILEFARRAPGAQDPAMVERLERQIGSALTWLEVQRPAPFFHGPALTVADITSTVALTYLREKLPRLLPLGAYPALEAHRAACEMMVAFQSAPYSAAEALQTGWRPETLD